MKLLNNYVLVGEIIKFSSMSSVTIYRRYYENNLRLGKLSFVKKSDLVEEDRKNLENFTDLSNLYPMGELSILVGRDRDHFSYMMHPPKTSGIKPKPIKVVKIGNKYNMIKLTEEFIINIKKGLTPFAINTSTEIDYEEKYKEHEIINFYEMKIGFFK